MHFGENQLSPSSIGISPLPTAHPNTFPRVPVRASTPCYRGFTLAMGSSLGFGSAPTNLSASEEAHCALFRLAFAAAPARQCLNLSAGEKQLAGSFFNRHAISRLTADL